MLDLPGQAAATPVPANDDNVSAAVPKSTRSHSQPKRNIGALPKHLPRVEEVIEPETTICPCCARQLHRIGEDVAEAVDRVPEVFSIEGKHHFGQQSQVAREMAGPPFLSQARSGKTKKSAEASSLVALAGSLFLFLTKEACQKCQPVRNTGTPQRRFL
jgi:transposase